MFRTIRAAVGRNVAAVFCALLVLFLTPQGSPTADAQGLTPVRLGISLPVAAFYPIYIADELGFFEEEGLDVEVLIFRGGPETLPVLLAGEIDVACTPITEALTAFEAGRPLKIFWPVTNRAEIVVVSQPHLKTPEDLRGKNIGLSSYGGLLHFTLKTVLEGKGLDPDRDVRFVQVGGQYVEALEIGSIDAAPMPGAVAQTFLRKGYVHQGSLRDHYDEFPVHVYMTPGDRLDRMEDTFRRLARATQKAARWFRDPANKDRAIQVLIDVLKMTPEVAAASYTEEYELDSFPTTAQWPLSGIEAAIEFARAEGQLTRPVTPDDLIDYRFSDL